MRHRDKRRQWLRVLAFWACLVLLAAGCSLTTESPKTRPESGSTTGTQMQEEPKLKVALILPGTVEDADYNFVGYRALQEVKDELGISFKYQERVAPVDAGRVARGFINDGYNVIIFHGGQYVTTVRELAPQFPEIHFVAESSGPIDFPDNVWNIGRKFYQGFYPLGTLGGLATKSNKIGVVVGVRLPDFIASINAIKWAARSVNPNVQVIYNFVGDQNDPVKARQAAEAQINAGADFIISMVNLGTYGVIEAAKGKKVLLTTFYTDKYDLAPENFTASLLLDFSVPYKAVLRKIQEGVRSGYEEMRPGNGMELSEIRNVPPDVAQKVQEIFQKIASKELQIQEKIDAIEE